MIKKVPEDLLTLLADGEFHSGESIGRALGVSRTAVWKQRQQLSTLGLTIESIRGKGYRLTGGWDLLSADAIAAALSAPARALITAIDRRWIVDSTNAIAMAMASKGEANGYVCLAEYQSAGRGRRGRRWHSPFGHNIYLSIVWEFMQGAAALGGLSLAVAVVVAQVLKRVGLTSVSLKWPNDILVDGHKLGGILLEMQGDPAGHCRVVIGIGLNIYMPKTEQIDQPWTHLRQHMGQLFGNPPTRNQLVAQLLNELMPMLDQFAATGFGQYQPQWCRLDAYAGRHVQLQVGTNAIAGRVLGVTDQGALRLLVNDMEQHFYGGEISMRLSNDTGS